MFSPNGYFRENDMVPIFSVVICTYNDGEYLSQAIESVMDQTVRDWELIIVDDGSRDNTAEILSTWKTNPKIQFISLPHNKGKAVCLNIALEVIRGTWLVELDADDWLAKSALELLNRLIEPETVAYYGNYAVWREHFRSKELTFTKVVKGMPAFNAIRYLENAYPLAPRIYRADALRKIDGWHTNDIYQSRLYEDVYILCALSKQGKVEHLDELLYHRRLRSGSVSVAGKKEKFEKWVAWVKEELFM